MIRCVRRLQDENAKNCIAAYGVRGNNAQEWNVISVISAGRFVDVGRSIFHFAITEDKTVVSTPVFESHVRRISVYVVVTFIFF